MNLVITSMVNQTALDMKENRTKINSSSEVRPKPPAFQPCQDGPFVWDSVVTGDVVGMFFAGYMVFQVSGSSGLKGVGTSGVSPPADARWSDG
jgi:hypothetical protein